MSQNSVKKYAGKSHIFRNIFFLDFFWTGLDLAHSFWAGPDLSALVNSGDGVAKKKTKKKEEGQTYGGFEVLLAVADRRTAWTMVDLSSSSLCFFFCSVLFCFCFLNVSSSPHFCLLLLLSSFVSNGG
jgi:hypothetical protein